MKSKCLIIFLSFTLTLQLSGQYYPVSDIAPELKKGADVIVRHSEENLKLVRLDDMIYSKKVVYTILNSDGFWAALFYEYYDKFSKVRNIKITYYDSEGEVLKKVRSSEIEDINVTSSGSVYDDNRIKYFEPEEFDYPFTVAYEYEQPTKSTYTFYPFMPQFTDGVAVEKAVYKAGFPSTYELRHKELNGIASPEVTETDKIKTYTWTLENEPAISEEVAGESARAMAKSVLLAPSTFSMEGYLGDLSTWNGFGTWQKELNRGRDVLPSNVKSEIDELLSGISDDKEKVRLIYEYLQKNTRYVSIQLGVGGWQPFPATMVAENGYGDCKALSNFTASLLKYAGIKSNYVKIRAGDDEDDIVTDFPSNQFNHVILAVPMEQDTIWLECTNQEAPFNFLGGFTSDRHALMVTDEGGVLVKTPEYTAEENSQIRHTRVTLDSEGNAKADVKTVYRGRQYDNNYRLAKKGKTDQRKYLLNSIDIPAFDLGSFSYEERKTEDPLLTETYDLTLRKYGSTTGKRLFFVPNLLNRSGRVPPKDENRRSAIIRRFNYMDVDSVVFKLPENYRMEFEPKPVEVTSEFGEYRLSYHINTDTNELTYVRYIKVYKGRYPANAYADFRNFWRKVSRSDKSKLVLIGNT